MSTLQPITELQTVTDDTGAKPVKVKAISIYRNDPPMTPQELAIQSVKIRELFNIPKAKAKIMMEIMAKKGWSKRKCDEAIEYVIETNVYNTTNTGIEPGKILSYDRQIKLYTQEDVMVYNEGTGTHGFRLVKTDIEHTLRSGAKTFSWYVKESDLHLLPPSWEVL